MVNPNIDYVTTNFEYPVLTKIHGIPTYEALRKIKNEIKYNTASVPCDLGGGNHGHLGVVLTQVEYSSITITPYVRSVHSGIVNIAVGTPNYEATRLCYNIKEAIRLNREDNNVKKVLLKTIKQDSHRPLLEGVQESILGYV